MQIAQQYCEESKQVFSRCFRYQFLLSRHGGDIPDGWQASQIGQWTLRHCGDLPVCPVTDATGQQIGLFLGIGVTASGDLVKDGLTLGSVVGSATFWTDLETEIAGIAGRYALILAVDGQERMYFDPVLDLSVVYDKRARVVASSMLLALTRRQIENVNFNDEMIKARGYNVGMQNTRDAHIRRAIPNHFLGLRDFVLHRHWPRGDEDFTDAPGRSSDVAERIFTRLGQVFGAIVREFDCVVPITGGHDSRNLLAAGQDHLEHVTTFFTHKTNMISGLDCEIGRKIMARLGFPHQVLDVTSPDISDRYSPHQRRRLRADFFGRVGFEAMPNLNVAMALDSAPKGQVLLRGNVMDMLAANQYTKNHKPGLFNLAHALHKLHLVPGASVDPVVKWGESYLSWVDSLPSNAMDRIYDFAFIEQLLPNTLGARFYGNIKHFYMNPFSDRRMIADALCISPEFRRQGGLNQALLSLAPPDLAQIPFLATFKLEPLSHKAVAAR